jgi:hypothetical protein
MRVIGGKIENVDCAVVGERNTNRLGSSDLAAAELLVGES